MREEAIMKLAASDYDGTLFRHREVAREDVEAIHAWRRAGTECFTFTAEIVEV